MPFKVFCERCGRRIADVAAKDLREWSQKNDEVCRPCKRAEDELKKFYELKRKRFEEKIATVYAQALEELVAETKRLAARSRQDASR